MNADNLTQAILESALDSIIVIDAEGCVREFNPAAERMFGYTRAEAIGAELATLIIPEESRGQYRQGLAHFFATGEGPLLQKRIEQPALRKDGSELLVELAITPYEVEGRAFFTAYLRDITARKAGEEARRRLAAIVESSDDAIISKTLDGTIMSWNRGAERLFGYEAGEVIGENITILMPPERYKEEPGILERIRRGERIEHYETVRRKKDGTLFNISLTVSPIKDEGGNVIGASKIARDITKRVQSDRRRATQYAIATLISENKPLEETVPRILEAIAGSDQWLVGSLWLRNADGDLICQFTWQKDSPNEFSKASRGRVFARGEGLPGAVLESGKAKWLADFAQENLPRSGLAAAAGLRGAFAFPLLTSQGVIGVIEILSDQVVSPDEDFLHLTEALGIQVGLYLQRKQAEEELRRQKETAEAANQAKDKFLAALSHELRTPLNPVLMWACATVEDEKLSPEFKEGLRMICRNVELEARLIDDLLDLTRISRGKLQLNLQPCGADKLLRHAYEIVRSQGAGKNLEVSMEMKATNHLIMADPTRIQQVFWNVLKNAIKFTPEGGKIWVSSRDGGPDTVVFEISDTGRGVEPDVMPRLFTAFEQGSSSSEGLGLGLTICKAILELHHGTITAGNRSDGHGAVFTIQLKTIAEHVIEKPWSEKRLPAPSRKLRILILEDHEYTAAVMSRLLKRDGHDVITARTVRQAFEVLKATKLDLLVSDLGLPDGNGFQVMRELAKISNAKGIAVSGYGMDDDVERSSLAGFSAHLTKPINVQELQETIQLITKES
ncbi:MAG: PAS domain S-box protein [Chthoniobacterales bacterium]